MNRRTIYNDDSQGVAETSPGSVENDLRAWVDLPLTRIPIDTYAWCIAFPDIVMHDSRIGEVYGRRFPTPPNQTASAIAELREEGTDVLRVVASQARKHAVEFVASVRMNDTHHRTPDPRNPAVPQLLLDHPEYAIIRQDGLPDTALDYSHAGVREHRFAILRELVEEYDIDGMELDFTRWGKFFSRNEAPFRIDIMNGFVARLRQMLDQVARKRKRKRLVLGVQVLRSLYLNHLCGLDPRAWVADGSLDYLIQCDWNCTDPQVPVAEFAAFCADSSCTHHVRMGNLIGGQWRGKPDAVGDTNVFRGGCRGYAGMMLTPEKARAAAANIYGFGADGIGLWNLCCNMGKRHKPGQHGEITRDALRERLIAWACEVACPAAVFRSPRVYHFVPIYKSEHLASRNYPVNALRLGPAGEPTQIILFDQGHLGIRQVYRFQMADGQHGGTLRGTLRVRILQSTPMDRFAFDINGRTIGAEHVRREVGDDPELPFVWYEVDLCDCPPFAGQNELGMTLTEQDPDRKDAPANGPYEPCPYMEELTVSVRSHTEGVLLRQQGALAGPDSP